MAAQADSAANAASANAVWTSRPVSSPVFVNMPSGCFSVGFFPCVAEVGGVDGTYWSVHFA